MKKKKKEFNIFNLSFLDIISCGFGAVVLLVLISNTADNTSTSSATMVEELSAQLTSIEQTINELTRKIDTQKKKKQNQIKENTKLWNMVQTLSRQVTAKEKEENVLTRDLEGLSLVQSTLQRISIAPATTRTTRDEEVGGIPVDSDYVIFIVDTSGSMQSIWARVLREILNVLDIHPKVKGFQIINDQGIPLVSAYRNRWIPDTPQRRKNVMKIFGKWKDASNSSPVEGIETALKLYAKPGRSTSIYVFGDDYTGSSYEPVIEKICKMNKNQINGQSLAKIHGIGFLSQRTTGRFGILMRELTKRNKGTFLALPL